MWDDFVNVELARLRGVIEALRSGSVGAHRPFSEAAGRLLLIVRERVEAAEAVVVQCEDGAGSCRTVALVSASRGVVPHRELTEALHRACSIEPVSAGEITDEGEVLRVGFDAGGGGQGGSGWLELKFDGAREPLHLHERQLVLAMARWVGRELSRRAEEQHRLGQLVDPEPPRPLRWSA